MAVLSLSVGPQPKKHRYLLMFMAVATGSLASPCLALHRVEGIDLDTRISLSEPLVLSDQSPDLDLAYKPKLVRLGNGTLIVVYGDAVEDVPSNYIYDLREAQARPARDVFIRVCDSGAADCTLASNWSVPFNLSNTAALSSIDTDWDGDSVRTAYHGDSDNAHLFGTGNHAVVTWVDKYCPGGAQRMVTYAEYDNREVAMGCVYAAHASANYADAAAWTVDRLSDGSRDAKQDSNHGLSSGGWGMVWQEDPLGLQPGEAEGPGEGSSGAKVSKGTDIWYTYTSNVAGAGGDIGVWAQPLRLTDNLTGTGAAGHVNLIRDAGGSEVPAAGIETGIAGASRANLKLVGGSSPPTAVIAYEETKGSGGLDEGKFLRYHSFAFNNPPVAAADKIGCILSDPAENARRARIVSQNRAGPQSALRWSVLWRQGTYTQGGPADFMVRLAFNGFAPGDLLPAVDPDCNTGTSDYAVAIQVNNAPAFNVSSNTPIAAAANLGDATGTNILENARAHRAVMRGDDFFAGYIYTPDWAVAENTDLENYNFFMRHYDAGAGSWSSPRNLSKLADTTINVIEPRLIGTPGNGPGCTDPDNITNPVNCQNPDALIAAWGTQTNVYAHIGGAEYLDVSVARTTDKGENFSQTWTLAGGAASQGEAQLRVTPDASQLYVVWNETDVDGASNSAFAQALFSEQRADSDDGPLGCSLVPSRRIDPLFALLVLTGTGFLLVKRASGKVHTHAVRQK